MPRLIEVKDLQTEFGTERGTLHAVNGVSYHVDAGEIIAFVGESGCGKSVTQYSGLQLIPTAKITRGEIRYNGVNILDYAPGSEMMRSVRGGEIGLIFQEPMTSLNPVMTIGRQLTEGMRLHLKISREAAYKRAADLMRQVGIPDPESRLKDYPHQFSGGMRQRVMIAMALASKPKLLIADEATTALDVTTQAQVLDLMRDIVRENQMSLIIITHNLSVVAQYAQRVYVMYAGEIVESAPVKTLFHDPRHPYTIGLLNALPGLKDPKERKLIPIEGVVTSLIDRKAQCAFCNRCPFAEEACRSEGVPALREVGPEHRVACLRDVNRAMANHGEGARSPEKARRKPDDKPLVEIRDLKVYFPVLRGLLRKKVADVKAVDGVSFSIYPGETFGLVGESGCGKSTVAHALLRLTDATDGQIFFGGRDITRLGAKAMREVYKGMSMVFQDPFGSLDPRMRASDIVLEPLKNSGARMTRKELSRRAEELFALVGLDWAYRERVPHEFSGGQRQRLAIARALSTNPSFIVCDEAISSLDVSIQAQIINLLEELQSRLGLTYLFIAHDLSVVRHISDRLAVMYLGQLAEIGPWQALYERPVHPYTQALLAAVPTPEPDDATDGKRAVIAGEVPSPMQRPRGCAFSNRCPRATPACGDAVPQLVQVGDGHFAACHVAAKPRSSEL